MTVLCTICAREGSKGLVGKALCLVNGKPLIAYTIEQALKSKIFDHVVLSTDSQEIAEKSKNFGAFALFLPFFCTLWACQKIKKKSKAPKFPQHRHDSFIQIF